MSTNIVKKSEIHRFTKSENGLLEKDKIKGHIYEFNAKTKKGTDIVFSNNGSPGSAIREKKVNFSQPVVRNSKPKRFRKTPKIANRFITRRRMTGDGQGEGKGKKKGKKTRKHY